MTDTKNNEIDVAKFDHIVVLTGAGISVASGLKAFRGPGGIWEEVDVDRYGTKEALENEPLGMWKLWGGLRPLSNEAKPNAAHDALAEFEARVEDSAQGKRTFTLITQNIDGLHGRAGSKNNIEIHGNVHITKCSNDACQLPAFEDAEHYTEELPLCPDCKSVLRPDIVLFNEMLPESALKRTQDALAKVDLFIAVGTSGSVYPAANFVAIAKQQGAKTVLVNLETMVPTNPYFDVELLGPAEVILPELFNLAN